MELVPHRLWRGHIGNESNVFGFSDHGPKNLPRKPIRPDHAKVMIEQSATAAGVEDMYVAWTYVDVGDSPVFTRALSTPSEHSNEFTRIIEHGHLWVPGVGDEDPTTAIHRDQGMPGDEVPTGPVLSTDSHNRIQGDNALEAGDFTGYPHQLLCRQPMV